jgi:phosphate transport system substrate-binding protein
MNRIQHVSLTILVTLLFLSGCSGSFPRNEGKSRVLRIKGSDTMIRLVERWAQEYMSSHREIAVYAEGGGSAMAIQSLIKGSVDICASSRPLLSDEMRQLAKRYQSLGFTVLTAKDALSVYVNAQNPVNNLTVEEIRDIYTGKKSSWKDFGGWGVPIRSLSRNPNSGTYLFFEEHLLGAPYGGSVEMRESTSDIVSEVMRDSTAIGYGGVAYGSGVTHILVNGVAPTTENVRNGSYPLARYLYLFTVSTPQGDIKEFLDWVIGPEGQRVVREIGYIPLYETPRE